MGPCALLSFLAACGGGSGQTSADSGASSSRDASTDAPVTRDTGADARSDARTGGEAGSDARTGTDAGADAPVAQDAGSDAQSDAPAPWDGTGSPIDGAVADADAAPLPCVTVGPLRTPHPKEVQASGAPADAVFQALQAALVTQSSSWASATEITLSSLACADIEPPMGASGYDCAFGFPPDAGDASVDLGRPSQLAQNILDALADAGATPCGPMGVAPESIISVSAYELTSTATSLRFGDTSIEDLIPEPTAVVDSAHGQAIVSALAAAGLDDCSPERAMLLVCTKFSTAPTCGVEWNAVDPATDLLINPICAPAAFDAGSSTGPTLTAAHSKAVWSAILAAAESIGFAPLSGTLAGATVLNASYFGWDNGSLAFTLVVDDATPPPPLGGDGGVEPPDAATGP